MESVLQHPDMIKITNGNSIREEEEEDLQECYEKFPEKLPVEPLTVGYTRGSATKIIFKNDFLKHLQAEKKVGRNSSFKSSYTFSPRQRNPSGDGKRVIVMKAEEGGG